MRHDGLYLNDIVEAADRIAEFIAGIDPQGFQNSELVRSAVVQKLGVIGEAAAHVSEELVARYPEIPWPKSWPSATYLCTRTSESIGKSFGVLRRTGAPTYGCRLRTSLPWNFRGLRIRDCKIPSRSITGRHTDQRQPPESKAGQTER